MKILQIVHDFPPHNAAGTEIYAYSLCRKLSEGHKVFVFHRVSDLKRKECEVDRNKFEGLDIFTINNTFRSCNSFERFYRDDDITRQFVKILDKVKPDLVHIQHLIFLSTTIIAEIKKRKIPIVFTLHDYWLICAQWHFLKKDVTICDNHDISQCVDCLDHQLSIKKIPKSIYLTIRNIMPVFLIRILKYTYLSWMRRGLKSGDSIEQIRSRMNHMRDVCKMVDIFIAPSQFLKTKFIEFGIPEAKIRLISNGVDTKFFEGFKRRKSDKIRFGFIGTILPAKGLHVLIDAFNMIKDDRAELKIYGNLFSYNGFEYYPKYIQKLAKNRNIRFMGGFAHKDLTDIFSEIDVLVLPSIWYENSPLVVQEAFLAHVPVIASNIGGIPELVQDGKNGLLFQANNEDELYQKIKLIIDEPNLITTLGRNTQIVKDMHENAREIEGLYNGLLVNN